MCINDKKIDFPDIIKQVKYECPANAYQHRKFGITTNIDIDTFKQQHEIPHSILVLFNGEDTHYILFGSLGDFTGAYLGKQLSRLLTTEGSTFNIYMTVPYSFESSHKRSIASEIKKDYASIRNVTFLDLEA